MLQFRELTLADRAAVHAHFFARANGHGCEYSFAALFAWGEQRIAFFGETPLFLSRFGERWSYLFPLCEDTAGAINALRQDAREHGIPFRLFGLLPREAERLNALFPGEFTVFPVRDSADYVYEISRLAELSGKHLQPKRNHCNHFEKAYPDYRALPLTEELLPRCIAFTERWYALHEREHPETDFSGERAAIGKVFANFQALSMEGLVLETEDGIVAFSMGNQIREDVFDVGFEKALSDVNGAYAMINREFARRVRAVHPAVRWLNREDDMGLAGLRQAKESYTPDLLLEKLVAEAAE